MKHRILMAGLILAATSADAASEAKKKVARTNDPDAVRCIRQRVTGSLAQTKKVCMTNRDWRLAQDDARQLQSLVCAGSKCQGK